MTKIETTLPSGAVIRVVPIGNSDHCQLVIDRSSMNKEHWGQTWQAMTMRNDELPSFIQFVARLEKLLPLT